MGVNFGMKCFFSSNFKGKKYGKYKKGTIKQKYIGIRSTLSLGYKGEREAAWLN